MKTRKLQFVFIFLMLLFSSLINAQWTGVYTCDVTPDNAFPKWEKGDFNHPGAFLDPSDPDYVIWQDTSKSAFWTVVDDPDRGNKYITATTFTSQDRGDTLRKRESWIMNFEDADTALADQHFTVVFRTKPSQEILDAVAEDPNGKYNYSYVSYRNKINKCELQWDPQGYLVKNTESDTVMAVEDNDFHVFRFTIENGGDFNVYFDEDDTPTISGTIVKSDKTRYLKFGSKSSSTNFGGVIDFVVWSVNGAYSPGEMPLPEATASRVLPQNVLKLNNYPNPFNSHTQINFSIEQSAFTSLTIYDIQGRKVKTLVDEYRIAGTYNEKFETCNLPAGVYFYELRSGRQIHIEKMIKQ